jgi:putative phosphoesterase
MKIAVLSDSHDNIWKLRAAIPHLREAEAILHCGDLCAPFMIRELAEPLPDTPIHAVWGNNDGDTFLTARVASSFPNVELHGILAEVEIDGLKIAVNHYPRIAEGLAASGSYDLVCYGHDHQAQDRWVGECLLLNPGELMGMSGVSSFAMLSTTDRSIERIEV